MASDNLFELATKHFEAFQGFKVAGTRYHSTILGEELVGVLSFEFPGISFPIRVRAWRNFASGVYSYELSHFIKTPIQADSYRASNPTGENLDVLLARAIGDNFVDYYKLAVQEGHTPDDSWFEINEHFRPV